MYNITSKIKDSVDYNCNDDNIVTLHSGINEVDDAGLESLIKNVVFQSHLKNGFMAISEATPIIEEKTEIKKSKKSA